jgi:hypothetical protein
MRQSFQKKLRLLFHTHTHNSNCKDVSLIAQIKLDVPAITRFKMRQAAPFPDISYFRIDTTSTARALLIEQYTGENTAQPLAATKNKRNNLQRMRK